MPAKIIVKSGYIKNDQHKANALFYAGNKIEAQIAVMEDGSTIEVSTDDILAENEHFAQVQIKLKNGKTIELSPEQYRQKVKEREQMKEEQILHLEEKEKSFSAVGYIKYIAFRKSVENAPGHKHGLFTLDGDADIPRELAKLQQYKDSVMWSHIISLERPDAERTGYDRRSTWRNLVTAKSMEIAKIYNIDPRNLVINAAYHDKEHHPHLHLYFYSTDPREGIVKDMEYASRHLKSLFFNEIFKDDVSYLKEIRTDQRSQLEVRLEELLQGIQKRSYRPPKEVCDKLLELSFALQDYKGKNVYAFHAPEIKGQVDVLVESMVKADRHLAHLFDAYLHTQRTFAEQYQQDPAKIAARMQEFTEHFFHPRPAQRGKPGTGDRVVLHNKVLRYARALEESVLTLEEKPIKRAFSGTTAKKKQSEDTPRPLENEVTTLYNEIKEVKQELLQPEEQYRLASYLQRDLFMGLLKTTNNKSPLRQEILILQGDLSMAEDVSFSELPKETQEQINGLLRKLLKDHPSAKQHAELLAELFSPGKRTPTGLQNTVMRFARRYDEYVKRQIRQKARYTAKLLLRSCAYELAKLARENEQYNNRYENRETNLTEPKSMGPWHNYITADQEYQSYD